MELHVTEIAHPHPNGTSRVVDSITTTNPEKARRIRIAHIQQGREATTRTLSVKPEQILIQGHIIHQEKEWHFGWQSLEEAKTTIQHLGEKLVAHLEEYKKPSMGCGKIGDVWYRFHSRPAQKILEKLAELATPEM